MNLVVSGEAPPPLTSLCNFSICATHQEIQIVREREGKCSLLEVMSLLQSEVPADFLLMHPITDTCTSSKNTYIHGQDALLLLVASQISSAMRAACRSLTCAPQTERSANRRAENAPPFCAKTHCCICERRLAILDPVRLIKHDKFPFDLQRAEKAINRFSKSMNF